MMPEMNGYNFYKAVSENPEWSPIPFIFLTAKSDPEDVRFGKMLGVDDYITKPFEEQDLLASIAGKLSRSRKTKQLRKQIEEKLLTSLKIDVAPSVSKDERESVCLLLMVWDEIIGPELKACFPTETEASIPLEKVGIQLFFTTVSLYGHDDIPEEAQGVLLRIMNINRDGYAFFDAIDDEEVRGGKRQFMLVVLAPKINYLESSKIRELLVDYATKMRTGADWDIKECWEKVSEVLITPIID